MWWFLKKITDNEQAIEYSYGCLSEKTSGIVRYDKVSEESSCIQLADGDTKKGVSVLLEHIWGIANRENAPSERKIAIG